MPTILVTGAAGFIGSTLSEFLVEKGFLIKGIDNFDPFYDKKLKEDNLKSLLANPAFSFLELDISRQDDLERISGKFDAVIHIAAKAGVQPSLKDPKGYINTNITGTQNILDLMRKLDIRKMVFASSSSVYGNQLKVPFSEKDNVDYPISPYAFTKKACELLNHTYHHLYKIDIINLRFFTVFGPRQRPDLAIHKFIKQIEKGEAISMYGDGSSSRDYTFISDIIAGIYGALTYLNENNSIFETTNLGNNHPVKLLDLIHLLYRLMETDPNIKRLPMQPGDVTTTYADISKASKLFGYSPKVKFEDGLQQFLHWYKTKSYSDSMP
jgi:UDP-glucuronate 4-epimerase